MDELLGQAKINVQKRKDAKLRAEIREEYKRLKFESEKVEANEAVLAEINKLYQKCSKFPAKSVGDSYVFGHKCAKLNEMLEEKKYHPKELEELRKFVKERILKELL